MSLVRPLLTAGLLLAGLGCGDDGMSIGPDGGETMNDCGGAATLPQVPGTPCGCRETGTWTCDGEDALACVGADGNSCGGCDELPGSLGEPCGTCGTLVCDGTDSLYCEEAGTNACGGCAELVMPPGAACGTCDAGTVVCAGTDSTTCDEPGAPPTNVCGGCADLTEEPGSPCGDGCGSWVCDGMDALTCDESAPTNACGGCEALTDEPGTECGCGGVFECASVEEVVCTELPCGDVGDACATGGCATGLACTAGVCAPTGWTYVPAGTFVMGAPPTERGFHSGRENGQHTVTITRPFLAKQTTVTQGEYFAVVGERPSYFANCGDDCPVERLSWWEMLLYANRLSVRDGLQECYTDLGTCSADEGAGCAPDDDHCGGFSCSNDDPTFDFDCTGYRLPTESEWEYMARAGTQTAFLTASGTLTEWGTNPLDAEMDVIAWYGANSGVSYSGAFPCDTYNPTASFCGPHPVGMKAPNGWALFDMTGNVWERVWDRGGDYPAPGSTVVDPTGEGPVAGSTRRIRGGAFALWGQYLRVAYRSGPHANSRYYNIGFRLVRTLP